MLAAALMAGGLLAASSAQAVSVSRDFSGNDCTGYFGGTGGSGGFDACTVFVNSAGVDIQISPVIAKYKGDLTLDETNGSVYPTVDGSEFSFSNPVAENKTGDWAYAQGTDDPYVRFWATKASNGFILFWDVDQTALDPGGACDVIDVYTLDCLNAASTVSSGSWTTLENKALSHITFYDSDDAVVPPDAIPVPASVWLFGSGLLGLVGIARRRKG